MCLKFGSQAMTLLRNARKKKERNARTVRRWVIVEGSLVTGGMPSEEDFGDWQDSSEGKDTCYQA